MLSVVVRNSTLTNVGKMPETIGRYEIREEIGEGGMGMVYRAYDLEQEREVAIKVLQRQPFTVDPDYAARFDQEARTIATLEHSSIVPLYETGKDGEWRYIVMRLMKGGTLAERLEQGPLSLEETTGILAQIGGALDKAHRSGIVHRDLKPANILFDEDGHAFLSDFGIAKIVKAQDVVEPKTKTGQILGTPQYMSPEQLDGEKLDGRSDIYSLGVVLFEMLSGRKPYDDESPGEIIAMHKRDAIPSIVKANSELPRKLEAVIQKAMAKKREDRYATAAGMVKALRQAGESDRAAIVLIATAVVVFILLVIIGSYVVDWTVGQNSQQSTHEGITGEFVTEQSTTASSSMDISTNSPRSTVTTSTLTTSPAPAELTSESTDTASLSAPTIAATTDGALSPLPAVSIAAPPQTPYLEVITSSLAIRSGPGADYEYLGHLKEGTKVPVFARTDTDVAWFLVALADIPGAWVYGAADAVAIIDDDPTLIPLAGPTIIPPPPTQTAAPIPETATIAPTDGNGNGGDGN